MEDRVQSQESEREKSGGQGDNGMCICSSTFLFVLISFLQYLMFIHITLILCSRSNSHT